MSHESHNTTPNPWSNTEALIAEIAAKAVPVNYTELVGDNSVLMLGENHSNTPIREHIAAHATQLRAAGITHYAIEAPQDPAFDELNAGIQISLASVDLGPFSGRDKSYEQAVRAMSEQGIKIVPADIDQNMKPTNEERETFLTDSIKAILADDPNAKVAVLMGGFHTVKSKNEYAVPTMTTRLVDADIKVAAVQYAGGTETSPRYLLEAAAGAGMDQSEFMLDLRPYHDNTSVVYGPGATDHVIHLQQSPDTHGSHRAALLGGVTFGRGL